MSVPVETIQHLHWVLTNLRSYRQRFEDAEKRMYPFRTARECNDASEQYDLFHKLYNERCADLNPEVSPQVERFRRFLYGTWGQGLTLESLGEVRQELWFRHSLAREVIWGMTLDRAVELLTTPAANEREQLPGVRRDEATEKRDKFIYDECCKGTHYGQIATEVKRHNEWEALESVQGVKDAAKRYAKRHVLDPPPARQGGRQPKAKM